ncbi:MAG: hypothetical protein ACYC0U_06750 [Ilumatobacteraceae bacterium]
MSNEFILSEDRKVLIELIQERLSGGVKHLRILGEPGIGKTRLVLEAVRAQGIAPNVLYVEHGERFSRTQLFRELLRADAKYPLILVLDELSEHEMSDIWGHLKLRSGALTLISIDHGPDRSRDAEIEQILSLRLPDPTIREILASHVGEHAELNRWVSICEGSPRVAQAVGENLAANIQDILKPPATVPFWDRFLFGYAQHQSEEAHQIARVMRHIALFSRFGFEDPVGGEAEYIAGLVVRADPAITWQRFQELVQKLRERRVLQGSRTLFIVPKALHIYLWREYWRWYGPGFNLVATIEVMPESLQIWFMNMFRYAHESDAAQIVRGILRPDGVFTNHDFLSSAKGTSFLSTLAEADPESVLTLIEHTFGTWSREELLVFQVNRQNIVWALEKIAVWSPTVVRTIKMLTQFALTDDSNYSINATTTLLELFRIGPKLAATEASPAERLPALLEMLRSGDNDLKRLGLKVAEAALQDPARGFRIVGAEFQGIRKNASLWEPKTYGDWWTEYRHYWDCLISETRKWDDDLRKDANSAILVAAEAQLNIPPHKEMVLSMIGQLSSDHATDTRKLNHFYAWQIRNHRDDDDLTVYFRLRRLEGQHARHSLESRFQRYVLDTIWTEWDDHEIEDELREFTRPRKLVRALAGRVARQDDAFDRLLPSLVMNVVETRVLYAFGEALCLADTDCRRLEPLLLVGRETNNSQCLRGYLNSLKERAPLRWEGTVLRLLTSADTAAQGAGLILGPGLNDEIYDAWLNAFERRWIEADSFHSLCFGMAWQKISLNRLERLLISLANRVDKVSAQVLIEILDQALTNGVWPIDADRVFAIATAQVHFEEGQDTMYAFHRRRVCECLVSRDPQKAILLLDELFRQMGLNYQLSYDGDIKSLAADLCRMNPAEAWEIVASHLLSVAPKWRSDVMNWLKGGLSDFDENNGSPPIAAFEAKLVIGWIEQEPSSRAPIIAHCVSSSLDEDQGGALTRALLAEYRHIDGVVDGISASFHSGVWSGPFSHHLRKKRDQLRGWLSKGFDQGVVTWIEDEITFHDRQIENAEMVEERKSWSRP